MYRFGRVAQTLVAFVSSSSSDTSRGFVFCKTQISTGSARQSRRTMATTMALSAPRRRLIVCCDGTWKDSDSDAGIPSNVTKLSRAINTIWWDESTSPPTAITQVAYYQNGVGTGSRSLWQKYVGGATGEGISFNIREAYAFICQNYRHGDEIILIGFSRGAFTARSISSLIRAIGLLTPAGLEFLTPIFLDWKFKGKYTWKTPYPDKSWSTVAKVGDEDYQNQLARLELSRPRIPIKCVAVWDTVGALGIPSIWILPQNAPSDYQLVDTHVEDNIEYAYQALALDEHRRPYHPTVWERPNGQVLPTILKQTWFPGVHTDIGGSYADADLSNITLAWMVSQLDAHISLDHGIINREIRRTEERHLELGETLRPWGLGKIHNSMNLFFQIFGSRTRKPKEYLEIDWRTRTPTNRRLENTGERIHASVRIRMGREGRGYDDRGKYDPPALAGWTFTGEETAEDTPIQQGLPGAAGKMKNVVWKKTIQNHDPTRKGLENTLEMPEDEINGYERETLRMSPKLLNDIDCLRPGKHASNIRRASTYPKESQPTPKLAHALPHPGPDSSADGPSKSPRISTY